MMFYMIEHKHVTSASKISRKKAVVLTSLRGASFRPLCGR